MHLYRDDSARETEEQPALREGMKEVGFTYEAQHEACRQRWHWGSSLMVLAVRCSTRRHHIILTDRHKAHRRTQIQTHRHRHETHRDTDTARFTDTETGTGMLVCELVERAV